MVITGTNLNTAVNCLLPCPPQVIFGDVAVSSAGDRPFVGCTAIRCTVADQSALRALLTQLWDLGGELVLLADVARGPHGQEES